MSIHQVGTWTRCAVAGRAAGFTIVAALVTSMAARAATTTITCPGGEKRATIDVRQLASLCPSYSLLNPFAAWISLAPQVGVDALPFRKALTAIAEMNELMKGLAERSNRCELTRMEYETGVPQLLGRMKGEAADLDKLREKAAAAGHATDPKRLAERLSAFETDLRGLARLAGREAVLDRIDAQVRAMQLQAQGDFEGAARNIRQALLIDEKVFGPEHRYVAMDAGLLSQILFSKIDHEGAVAYGRRALAIGEKVLDPYDPAIARFAYSLALILVATGGDPSEEELLARRALAIEKRAYGSDVPDVATMSSLLGMIRRRQGFPREALALFEEAHRILAAAYGPESPEAKDAARQIEITRGMKGKG